MCVFVVKAIFEIGFSAFALEVTAIYAAVSVSGKLLCVYTCQY